MSIFKSITLWFLRLFIGGTFIYSGFVKGIDPWGTLYKLVDYMDALHLPIIHNLLLAGVIILCVFEFCIGVFLCLGCFRRSAPICAAVFMGVMLPLTLWIAVNDPVADCGCFGDALILSNWATFWKNIVLTIVIIFLLRYNTKIRWLIRPHLQWIAFILCSAYISIICFIGYFYQPLLDFRPYSIGNTLYSETDSNDPMPEYKLIYKKEGIEKAFDINEELPDEDDGWEFIRREETKPDSASEALRQSDFVELDESLKKESDKNFRIWNDDGEVDMTEMVLGETSEELILFMPDLSQVSVATTWQINSLYTWAQKNDINMIGVVSATVDQISDWRDISLAAYPIYTAEDTEIKMIARGNPAVVYLKDGKIIWKTTLRALGINDFQDEVSINDPESLGRDNKAILFNLTAIYIILLTGLFALSYIPVLKRIFIPGSKDIQENI